MFKKMGSIKKWGLAFILTVILYGTLFLVVFRLDKVEGVGMLPTLDAQTRIMTNRYDAVNRFDVILMKEPTKEESIVVKRVIGKAGDSVSFKDDELYLNDQQRNEPYLNQWHRQYRNTILTEDFNLEDVVEHTEIPKGYVFVLGDNRLNSVDSRYYGLVPENHIIGKVTTRFFPISLIE